MAEFPALPIFTDAYLGDTRHLTQAEHGAYLLLLMTAWRSEGCSLPDDDRLLARWAGCDQRTWTRQKATVMGFWTLGDDNRWRQKRLAAEWQFQREMSSKRAEAGRQSGLARRKAKALIDMNVGQTSDAAKPEQPGTPTPTPTPTPSKEESTSLRSVDQKPSEKSSPRGSRLPADWTIPAAWVEDTKSKYPGMPEAFIRKHAERFRNHWASTGGQRGLKTDWKLTWWNWIDKEADSAMRQAKHPDDLGGRSMFTKPILPGGGTVGKKTVLDDEEVYG